MVPQNQPPRRTLGAMRVVISGSSGLIGTALVARLKADGHEVVRLVRRAPAPGEARWDPSTGTLDRATIDGADAVVNLAGAGIGDKRWTDAYKAELLDSRLKGTELLARTIAAVERRPSVLLSGSAIGFYGATGDEVLDEQSPAGTDFLARLCVDWEAATGAASAAGVRVAHLRTGIVLAKHGGALKKQLPLFKFGLGGKFGSGKQYQSWISLADEVSAISFLLTAPVSGPVNLTAPTPVTNGEFTKVLASVLRRPAILPIPSFGPKLLFGRELVEHLLLTGQRVVPEALRQAGFAFDHPELRDALRAILA
jgi:uncharacterized protein (TIGR01777 family)